MDLNEVMHKGWFWTGEHWVLDVRVIGEEKGPGLYRLRMYVEGADYSDFTTNQRMQTVGVDKAGYISLR